MAEQPFANVTVIEFGQFVAVPYCAQLFSDGGAHVIKVEPHEGDPTRALAPIAPGETRHFLSRNRGKHSLPLDLRHEMAPRIIDGLLASADVALFNLRPGLADEFGMDFASLSARYPRLVVANVTAFGRSGPDAGLAGMDLVVQGRSGLMAAMGKVANGLPAAGDSPIADYMCAVLLAFGVSSALYRRERTGRGGEVDVSLLGAAMALQATIFTRVDQVDAGPHGELRAWLANARAEGLPFVDQLTKSPSVRPSFMTSVYYRTYATKDSALAVAAPSNGLQRRFLAATDLEDRALGGGITARDELASHYAALQAVAEARLASRTTAEWKAALDAAGVPASPVFLPQELLDDAQPLANGLLHDVEHPAIGHVRLLGSPIALDGDGFRPGPPTPAFGSETRSILLAAGLSAEEIERAIASGAVRSLDGAE